MREPAPLLCRGPMRSGSHLHCDAGVPAPLHAAYAGWAEHHNSCGTCGQQDYFMPGDVVIGVTDPLMVEGVVPADGREVTYRRAPDLAVLCPAGRSLFSAWRREANRHVLSNLPRRLR